MSKHFVGRISEKDLGGSIKHDYPAVTIRTNYGIADECKYSLKIWAKWKAKCIFSFFH